MPMTPEEYEKKRLAKIERLKKAAERAAQAGQHAYDEAHKMAGAIPFGQPILGGHHSEGRDRRYRARIHDKFRKSFEEQQRAEALAARAKAAELNSTIFSDDPAAEEKLEDKLARLVQRQELMKAANKLVRKNDRDGLLALGFSEAGADALLTPNESRFRGFHTYQFSNLSANIRSVKQRIEAIQARAQDQTNEATINGVRIVDNVEENRLQMIFQEKPPEAVMKELQSHGFRWAPSKGAWQRFRSNNAIYWAKQIARSMEVK